VGDAGTGHPDANVVSPIALILLLALTAIGRLARRAHPSTRVRLHQIELPLSVSTCIYESCHEAFQLGELVHDCHRYRVDDRILLHTTLSLRN